MMNDNEMFIDEKNKKFVREHWRMLTALSMFFSIAAVAGVYVALWFIESAQAVGFIPAALGQWTIGYVITFVFHLIFWELLLVVSWVLVIVALTFTQWYNKLPKEDRREKSNCRSKKESNAVSFLVGLTWLIVVWLDGNWNLAFQSWTFNYMIYSCLSALFWDLIIFGIPILLFFIWWIRKGSAE
jgi:hypothetical protein